MFSDIIFDYLKGYMLEGANEFVREENLFKDKIRRDGYEIITDEESEVYGKPKGKYELISIPDVLDYTEEDIRDCVTIVADTIKNMIGKITNKDRILVVGLGNRHISSDSLGTKVVANINITIENKLLPKVMAISPSVMGLTGIETVDIVEGVIAKSKPTHVIVIDSLCAGAVERLGKSIQITNTGICPGGGIGNKRKCIGKDIADRVFSIGVPLLIYASTFVGDTFNKFGIDKELIREIMQSTKKNNENKDNLKVLDAIKNILEDDVDNIIVSIKDIEDCVSILAKIISTGINIALGVDK
jgi:spore protease